jgi:hypothetical protein
LETPPAALQKIVVPAAFRAVLVQNFEGAFKRDLIRGCRLGVGETGKNGQKCDECGDLELLGQLAAGAWLGGPDKHGGSSFLEDLPLGAAMTGLLLLR